MSEIVLNEKVLGQVASLLKLDTVKLTEALTSDKIEGIEVPVRHFFTDEEKATLETNIAKSKYDEGKIAGVEMLFKNVKKEIAPDIDAKDFKELFQKQTERLKSEFGKTETEKILEKDKSIEALRELVKKKDEDFANLHQRILSEKANGIVNGKISEYSFNIPASIEKAGAEEVDKYISSKRELMQFAFNAKIEVKFDENGKEYFVDKSTGKTIVDNLQNNAKITDVMNAFVKQNYFDISEEKRNGRGGGNSQYGSDSLRGLTLDQLNEKAAKEGITRGTNAYDSLYREWQKVNKTS